jgi:hypothetical protein
MPSIQLAATNERNRESAAAWRDSVVVLEQLLAEAKLDGEFTLRPVRQVRWNVQANGRGAVKLLHVHNHALLLRVRPPKADNGSVWEYALQPPRGLDPLSVLAGCNEALDRWHDKPAVPAADASPPPQASQEVNLLDLFARLQRARERSRERTRQLAAIDQQRQALQAEVRELHEAIGELDQEELRVLAAAETDTEADQAEKVLAALQGMLAGKEAQS